MPHDPMQAAQAMARLRVAEGDGWLPAAGALADEMHAAMGDDDGKPVELGEARAFTLWWPGCRPAQALR
jgi:hypothetical protein